MSQKYRLLSKVKLIFVIKAAPTPPSFVPKQKQMETELLLYTTEKQDLGVT